MKSFFFDNKIKYWRVARSFILVPSLRHTVLYSSFLSLRHPPPKSSMPTVAVTLASLQTLQAAGGGHTFSDLTPLQAALDAADAARYAPGATADDALICAINDAYGACMRARVGRKIGFEAAERAVRGRESMSHASKHTSFTRHTGLLASLLDTASDVDARLTAPIGRLLDATATATRLAHTKNHTADEVNPIQDVLVDVGANCKDGVYYGTPADAPAGQAYVSELVADLAEKCHSLLETAGEMNEATGRVYHALAGHHAHLAALARLPLAELRSDAHAHEVARIQGKLQEDDSARSAASGAFGVGVDGAVPPGQAACVDLLERCFRLAHKILVRTEKAETADAAGGETK